MATTGDFVREAAISDMFEIKSSKLAERNTSGPTQEFAAKMIADHSKTTSERKGHAKGQGCGTRAALDDAHQKMLDKLKGFTSFEGWHSF